MPNTTDLLQTFYFLLQTIYFQKLYRYFSFYVEWSGGGMALGKLSAPERLTNLDESKARAYCACKRREGGCLEIFSPSIIAHFFRPLCGKRSDID